MNPLRWVSDKVEGVRSLFRRLEVIKEREDQLFKEIYAGLDNGTLDAPSMHKALTQITENLKKETDRKKKGVSNGR